MDRTLEYLTEVARCGGLSKAARGLYITPSALSKFVLQRESELGVKLFNRDGNHFTLTYAGERYLALLQEVEDAQRRLDKEMGKAADLYMGKLRIGFQHALAESLLKHILPRLRERYVDIPFSLTEENAPVLKKLLANNDLDVVLTTTEEENPGIREERICASPIVLAGPKDLELLARARRREGFAYPWLSDEVIREVGFLDSDAEQVRRYAPHLYGEMPRKQSGSVVTGKAMNALLCVEQGMGLAPLSELLVREMRFEDRVRLFSFGPWQRYTWLSVFTDPRTMLEEETAFFVEATRECFGGDQK